MGRLDSEVNKWGVTRRKYLALHPPNHQGYYVCYLCRKWIPANEITLDHIIPRSRRKDLRHEFTNLAFCCWICNSDKGSKVVKPQAPLEYKRDFIDEILQY